MSDRMEKGILCTFPSSDDECSIVSVTKPDDTNINYHPYDDACIDIVNVYRHDITFCKTISGFIRRIIIITETLLGN